MDLNQVSTKSMKIRNAYHNLEEKYHGRKWTVLEDGLALSTDVGLINRLLMDQARIWPDKLQDNYNLEYKLGEVVWWLAVISEKNNINLNEAVENFINKKYTDFDIE
ncbi:hypothetical protein [Staphylococcus casei]|uniref:MazG-like protein n=1 Tax=Staphylococcus casei TaxID=201828 RepID=A0ABZ2WD26_9STAP|nr:hypothetical protein AST12_09600 [Staphylococcus succinus]